jgi:nucleoside-diphosphate-sugar epimerase
MPPVTPSDGPVAVTGASGYIGSHVVISLMQRGYEVRACVTDLSKPIKTDHLLALNRAGHAGSVNLHQANLLVEGSYDEVFSGCCAVLHVGTVLGHGNASTPRQIYDGAVGGTRNVMASVTKAGTVKRFIYTSSFSAIFHPSRPGYVFTEDDWASDGRENDPNWNLENLDDPDKAEIAYAWAKEETERMVFRIAEENGGFEAISICPIVVLGPLLSEAHDLVYSWQWFLGRMLRGKDCERGWKHLWNIVDVRDVAEAHALAISSDVCANGDRYQLSATDESGEIDCMQLQAHLQRLFPDIDVGGAPEALKPMLEKYGKVYDSPRAHCDKARRDLGLETHSVEDTLRETAQTMIDLGFVRPKLK